MEKQISPYQCSRQLQCNFIVSLLCLPPHGEQIISHLLPNWFEDVDQELQATAWAIGSKINSTSNHSIGESAFRTDMIFQSKVKVDWGNVKTRRRKVAIYNNARENSSHIVHEWKVGNKILIIPHNSDQITKTVWRTLWNI